MDLKSLTARYKSATLDNPQMRERIRSRRSYYMFNISHPVIAELLDRYREQNGLSQIWPLSDEDRLQFELSLLSGPMLRYLEQFCAEVERTQHPESA